MPRALATGRIPHGYRLVALAGPLMTHPHHPAVPGTCLARRHKSGPAEGQRPRPQWRSAFRHPFTRPVNAPCSQALKKSRVGGQLATRREPVTLSADDRVAEDQRDRRHLDRVPGRAPAAHRVGHVALVVGAVEVHPVPAVREVDVEPERLAGRPPGHAGISLDGGSPPSTPQFQNVTCAGLRRPSPSRSRRSSAGPAGTGPTGSAVLRR